MSCRTCEAGPHGHSGSRVFADLGLARSLPAQTDALGLLSNLALEAAAKGTWL
jgi:hypothetical protein